MSWKSVIVICIIWFFALPAILMTSGNNVTYVFLIAGVTSVAVAFADAYGNR